MRAPMDAFRRRLRTAEVKSIAQNRFPVIDLILRLRREGEGVSKACLKPQRSVRRLTIASVRRVRCPRPLVRSTIAHRYA